MSNLLTHQKLNLVNVSYSNELFQQELKKSFHLLNQNELDELYSWLSLNFMTKYPNIISALFERTTVH